MQHTHGVPSQHVGRRQVWRVGGFVPVCASAPTFRPDCFPMQPWPQHTCIFWP